VENDVIRRRNTEWKIKLCCISRSCHDSQNIVPLLIPECHWTRRHIGWAYWAGKRDAQPRRLFGRSSRYHARWAVCRLVIRPADVYRSGARAPDVDEFRINNWHTVNNFLAPLDSRHVIPMTAQTPIRPGSEVALQTSCVPIERTNERHCCLNDSALCRVDRDEPRRFGCVHVKYDENGHGALFWSHKLPKQHKLASGVRPIRKQKV